MCCREYDNDNNNSSSSSMTPLKGHEKCIPSRKRHRCQQPRSVKSRSRLVDTAALFDLLEEEEDLLVLDEEAQLTLEVASLKDAVGRMQNQVTAASAQLKELKALVATLMKHRAAQKQQELKKRRVDA